MALTLLATDSGAAAYEPLGSAAEYVGRARVALGSVTAATAPSFWETINPVLLFVKLGGQLNADLSTATGRKVAATQLGDLELALSQAASEAATLGDGPIGDANAARWTALLAKADGAGAAVTDQIKRVQAAAAPTNKIVETPGNALLDLGGGAAAGVGGAAKAVGWLARNLVWVILLGVLGLVGVLLLLRLPQRWLTAHRKGK
jgi:hypothetical protein